MIKKYNTKAQSLFNTLFIFFGFMIITGFVSSYDLGSLNTYGFLKGIFLTISSIYTFWSVVTYVLNKITIELIFKL